MQVLLTFATIIRSVNRLNENPLQWHYTHQFYSYTVTVNKITKS